MADTPDDLEDRLTVLTEPGFRFRLISRGLARSIIWENGKLPPGSQEFSPALTDDLLDYGHSLLSLALRLRDVSRANPLVERACLIAGEAIESAIHKGDRDRVDRGLHRITAAVAFHIARYSARSYSILPNAPVTENFSPAEECVSLLLRRDLESWRTRFTSWLLQPEHSDAGIATQLETSRRKSIDRTVRQVLLLAFFRSMALFDFALETGVAEFAARARDLLRAGSAAAAEFRHIPSWWIHTLASHLVDELWEDSLHARLPIRSDDGDSASRWNQFRSNFIALLGSRRHAAIELWPSQVPAAARAIDPLDNLVVALPTGAGKTRIAELCILEALSRSVRIVYVTPLRALSAQVERDLASTFAPLGFSVSALYGAAGSKENDFDTLGNRQIVIATPEKLDFAMRNNADLLNDVGLIILDEGHMIGPGEREIRYEALVQRLLRRPDAAVRRLVCLSALFPEGSGLSDFVAWMRRDVPGAPIQSGWRPTRQRFGFVRWEGAYGRLELQVDDETPYVERYIASVDPIRKRRNPFPQNKDELTVATAWRASRDGGQTMIFCALRVSVEKLAKVVLKLHEQGHAPSLLRAGTNLEEARTTGKEWLGANHPAVECLRLGVAVHHAGLPRAFLTQVEHLLRAGACRVVIASPTLAQGLNLSATTLLIPSLWRNKKIIPPEEFANVAGRAGRAHVDLDGVVLHIVYESEARDSRRRVAEWNRLIVDSRNRQLTSGILLLTIELLRLFLSRFGGDTAKVLEYVAGVTRWDYHDSYDSQEVKMDDWERKVASLDSAILGLVDPLDVESAQLPALLDEALRRSLWARQGTKGQLAASRALLLGRARSIWNRSTSKQRRGYYLAGLGQRGGSILDSQAKLLNGQLRIGEAAIAKGRDSDAIAAIQAISEVVLTVAPFKPFELPLEWHSILEHWLLGNPMSTLIEVGGPGAVDFIQDGVVYRLTWALEAIRVRGIANDDFEEDEIRGFVAAAAETGTVNRPAALLLRAGLASREAAIHATVKGRATFDDFDGMKEWLASQDLLQASLSLEWPTPSSSILWRAFMTGDVNSRAQRWRRRRKTARVKWTKEIDPPSAGTRVRLIESEGSVSVLSPDLERLGELRDSMKFGIGVHWAHVGDDGNTIEIEEYGPRGASVG